MTRTPIEIVLGWKAYGIEPQWWRQYDAVARIAPSVPRGSPTLTLLELPMGRQAFAAVSRAGLWTALPFDPFRLSDEVQYGLSAHSDMTLRTANIYKPPWRER